MIAAPTMESSPHCQSDHYNYRSKCDELVYTLGGTDQRKDGSHDRDKDYTDGSGIPLQHGLLQNEERRIC